MEWNKTYERDNLNFAYALVQTSDGGYAIAGTSRSELNSRNTSIWLVKTDASGNIEWNQTYGEGLAFSLVQTSDGGYALAGGNRLVKTDASGNIEWNQTYGKTGYEYASSLVVTIDGGFALAGSTRFLGAGYDDFWLVKTDASGNMEWNRTYDGAGYEIANSLVATSDGGYALAGYTWSHGTVYDDFWLVKTDASGNIEWNQTYGGAGYDRAYSLVVTIDGGFALAGSTRSHGTDDDFWLVKADASGNIEWNQTYGGAGYDHAYSLVVTIDGGYALTGETESFGAGSYDFWLIKTNVYGIPEFPSWIILPLLIVATVIVVITRKKLSKRGLE